MAEIFLQYISRIIAVSIVITFHEFAHSLVAVICGDKTPKYNNRLTLNPLAHFDLIGFISMILIGFGWAKPVPINPNNFKNKKAGIILVSGAGVFINLLMAFFIYPIYMLSYKLPISNVYLYKFIIETLAYILLFNISFAIFNFIPVFPLDGFNFIFGIFESRGKVYEFLKTKGHIILLVLILISFISDRLGYFVFIKYLDVFGFVMEYLTNKVLQPIMLFWNLILL